MRARILGTSSQPVDAAARNEVEAAATATPAAADNNSRLVVDRTSKLYFRGAVLSNRNR
jgi:hypothetical protein